MDLAEIFHEVMDMSNATTVFRELFAGVLAMGDWTIWVMFLIGGLLITVLSFVLAAPLCRQASGWDAARLVTARHAPGVPVYVYGGRYPVSFTYYSGIPAPRLVTRQRIRELRPNGISWKAKNMMPFAALEELPDTGKIMVLVDRSSQKDFLQTASGKWEKLGEGGRWTVWERK